MFADERELLPFKEFVRAELAGSLLQGFFRIEEVEMGRGADEVNVNDPFRFGCMMESGSRRGSSTEGVAIEQAAERGSSETEARILK